MILNDDILDAIRNKKYALKKVEPPILGIKLVNRSWVIEDNFFQILLIMIVSDQRS